MIGIQELLVILVIVVLLFGTKKLKTIGTDLGGALKGFRKAMSDDENSDKKDSGNTLGNDKPDSDKKD